MMAQRSSMAAQKGKLMTLKTFLPLELETRPLINTCEAAYYLNRKEQTLRWWAAYGCGPVLPRRINGRLGWPTAEIKKLVGVL